MSPIVDSKSLLPGGTTYRAIAIIRKSGTELLLWEPECHQMRRGDHYWRLPMCQISTVKRISLSDVRQQLANYLRRGWGAHIQVGELVGQGEIPDRNLRDLYFDCKIISYDKSIRPEDSLPNLTYSSWDRNVDSRQTFHIRHRRALSELAASRLEISNQSIVIYNEMDIDRPAPTDGLSSADMIAFSLNCSLESIPMADNCECCGAMMTKEFVKYEISRRGITICVDHIPGYRCNDCDLEMWNLETDSLMIEELEKKLRGFGRDDVVSVFCNPIKSLLR